MALCQPLDLSALSGFVAPYTEQITDLVDGKPEIACSRHPTKAVLFEAMVIDVVNFCNSRIEAADQRKPDSGEPVIKVATSRVVEGAIRYTPVTLGLARAYRRTALPHRNRPEINSHLCRI